MPHSELCRNHSTHPSLCLPELVFAYRSPAHIVINFLHRFRSRTLIVDVSILQLNILGCKQRIPPFWKSVFFVEFHVRSLALSFRFCSYHFTFFCWACSHFLTLGTNAAILPSLDCESVRDKKFAITVHPVLPVKIRSCAKKHWKCHAASAITRSQQSVCVLHVVCCRRVLNCLVLQASLVSLRKGSELFSVFLPNRDGHVTPSVC